MRKIIIIFLLFKIFLTAAYTVSDEWNTLFTIGSNIGEIGTDFYYIKNIKNKNEYKTFNFNNNRMFYDFDVQLRNTYKLTNISFLLNFSLGKMQLKDKNIKIDGVHANFSTGIGYDFSYKNKIKFIPSFVVGGDFSDGKSFINNESNVFNGFFCKAGLDLFTSFRLNKKVFIYLNPVFNIKLIGIEFYEQKYPSAATIYDQLKKRDNNTLKIGLGIFL